MMNYLQIQAVENSQKNILISGVNGVGIIQLLNSLEEISLNLTVTELEVGKAFMYLCYLKDKAETESKMIKKAYNK